MKPSIEAQEHFIKNILSTSKFIKPRRVEKNTGIVRYTGRVERMFKMVKYLSKWRSLTDMANYLGVSHKTIHRNISLLVNLGFEVEHLVCMHNLYRIKNVKEFFDL